MFQKSVKKSALKSAQKSSYPFKSTQNSAQKSSFPQKSAQKSTLKSTFGSSESIWDGHPKNVCSLRKENEFVMKKLISGDDSEDGQNADKSHIGLGHWWFVALLLSITCNRESSHLF